LQNNSKNLKTYQQTIDYLFEQLPMFQRIGPAAFKKDLTNTFALCEALGNPEKKFRSIHIAGTNGKGSVTHIIASVLQERGLKTGCYISPHYKDFRERIKINGHLIPEETVVRFVETINPLIDKIKPSFFEITVAMAFYYFAEQNVDVAVIETGMGGRLDSTNVILPELSVITNIAYDHQQFLGDTLPLIAGEKAGIIKINVSVLIGEHQKEIEHVFSSKAKETNSPLKFSDEICTIEDFIFDFEGSKFTLKTENNRQTLSSDLCGNYQQKNLQTAIAALLMLKKTFQIEDTHIAEGVKKVRKNTYFLGRYMILNREPLCIADSAHNEAGIAQLIHSLSRIPYQKLHFVYGTVNDKDLSKIFPLLPLNAAYYVCKPDIPRGLDAFKLHDMMKQHGFNCTPYQSVKEAYKKALNNAMPDDLLIVSGSIFVVAEVI
jgi:dihydrofolate synthase / folylpolyglutamate synthase